MKSIHLIFSLVCLGSWSYGNVALISFGFKMSNDSTIDKSELKYQLVLQPFTKHTWERVEKSVGNTHSPVVKGIRAMNFNRYEKASKHFHSLKRACPDKGIAMVNDGVAHYLHDYNLKIPMVLFYQALNKYKVSDANLLYNIALARFLKGDLKNARDTLFMLVDFDKVNPAYSYNAGLLYALMGADQKAIKQFEHALQYGQQKKEVLENLAWLYLKNENFEGVNSVLKGRLPRNFSMLLLKGEFFLKTQQDSKATFCFAKAHHSQAENIAPLIGLAKVLLQQGKLQQAHYYLKKAKALHGANVDIDLLLAGISILEERYDDALNQYTLLFEHEALRMKALIGAGMAWCSQRNFFKADSIFGEALKIDPKHVPALYNQGLTRFLSNEKVRSIEPLEAAIALGDFPQKKLANLMLGLAYIEMYDSDKALVHFKEAEGVTGENQSTLYLQMGSILYEQKKYKDALTYFDRLVKLEPANSIAFNNRGNTNFWLGNYESAATDFQTAVRLDSANMEAWNGLGLAKNQLGSYREALLAFQKAIYLDPTNDWYYSNLARTIREIGETFNEKSQADSAQFYFQLTDSLVEKAILLDSNSSAFHNNKGFALMSLKKEEEALNEFRRYPSQAALNNLAVYHSRRQEFNLALPLIEKAVAKDSNYSVPRYNRLRISQELSKTKVCQPCEGRKIERLREQEPLTSPFEDKYISIWYIHTQNLYFEKLAFQSEVPLPDLAPVFAPAKINFQVLSSHYECEAKEQAKNRKQWTSAKDNHKKKYKHSDCYNFKKKITCRSQMAK